MNCYIEKKVCFVHIPKTGGKSINRALYGLSQAYHMHIRRHKFLTNPHKFSVIRNPLSFYVSLYHFFSQNRSEIKNPLRFISYLSFPDFIYTITDYEKLKQWINENYIRPWHYDLAYIESRNKQIGLLSNYYLYLCCDDISILRFDAKSILEKHDKYFALDRVIKLENLPEQFESLMKEWKIPTLKLEKLNSSSHQHWQEYYNKKTKELVLDKDWLIFKLYYPEFLV